MTGGAEFQKYNSKGESRPAVTVPEAQLLEFIYFPNDPNVSDVQQRVWRQNGPSVRPYSRDVKCAQQYA